MFKKRRAADGGVAKTFLICFAVSVLIILMCALFSAVIINSMKDPTKNLGLFSLCSVIISAVISGVFCSRAVSEGELRFTLLVSLLVVLIMLMINVIICGGKVSVSSFMNYGCYLGIAGLSAFFGKKKSSHRVHRH